MLPCSIMKKYVVADMMPHQVEAVAFLRNSKGRALLADQMGLGKTRTVIEYLKQEKLRATVVTTKSFLYGWKAEVERWWPGATVCVVIGGSPYDPHADIFVTTYDRLSRIDTHHILQGTTAVIFDESHKLMNADTARSKAARRLVREKGQVICLTGTPMPNGQPRQLWHQMLLVGPTFMRWADFRDRFCDPKEVWAGYAQRYVWDYSGASNLQELRELLAPRFLRRTKKLLNLPPLTESDVHVPVRLPRDGQEPWPTYAQRLAVEKVKFTIELVRDCLDRGSKVIVFTSSIAARNMLIGSFNKCSVITAGMGPEERAAHVSGFQIGATSVFVATTQIAAEGITLTAADVVIYNDLPWSPGQLEQSTARAHRKGQEKPVQVYYVTSDTAYDRVVREALRDKKAVTEELLEERVR